VVHIAADRGSKSLHPHCVKFAIVFSLMVDGSGTRGCHPIT
jgi:hypothetical protein